MRKAGGSKVAQFHDLYGDKTAIVVRNVVGVEEGTYEVTRKVQKPKPWYPINPYSEERCRQAMERRFNPPKSLWQRLRNLFNDVEGTEDQIRERWARKRAAWAEASTETVEEKRRKPCTLIHLRIGSRTRTVKVREPFEEVAGAIEGDGK